MADAETLDSGVFQSRKEKRKALKKQRRKQIRIEGAIKEREEEEAILNDPDEQLRLRLKEEEEASLAERARKEFEERERIWLEKRKAEEEERKQREILEESENRKNQQIEDANKEEEDGEWEYEDGPAEIIWQGNEIIVKKKRVKVSKTSADRKTEEDVDRPTSNPLPPQSLAFASYNSSKYITAQEALEDVSQQVLNFGTEQDKAHCPFHLKTAACRFGTRCSRAHFYPDKSSTLLIKNMYSGPGLAWEQDEGLEYTDEEIERSFEEFYEDVHTEFLKFGELVNFKVCKNGSYHLRGIVYVHYKSLESAVLAYNTMNARYFAGKQITCEFVGVTRWKVAICGEYMKSRLKTCSHGTACNFIHCFRNPGRDYEWADWDNPPPKYWIKKMAVLFGPSDESGYGKQMEEDDFERSGDSSKKRTSIHSRYHSRRSYDDKTDVRDSGSGKETSDRKWYRHNRHSVEREHSRRSYDDKTDVRDCGSGQETSDRKWDRHNRHSVEREHSRRGRRSPDHKMDDSGSDRECSSQRRERHSRHSDRVHLSRSKETRFLSRSEKSERNHKSTCHDNNAEYRPVCRRSSEERSKDSEFLSGHHRHEKKLSMKEEKSERKHRFGAHKRHSEEDRPSDQLSKDTDESRDQSDGLSSEEYHNRHGIDTRDRYDGNYEFQHNRSHKTYNIEHKGKVVKQEVNDNRYTSDEPHDRWKAPDENSDMDENLGDGSDDTHRKESKRCGKTKYHRENHKKARKKRKHKVHTSSSDEEVDRRALKKSS